MQIPRSAVRVYAAIALAAALCLWCFIHYYTARSHTNQTSPDPYMIRDQLARYEGLRTALPQDAVIGYTSDLRPEDTRSTLLFLGAQYALAPRIVVDDDRHEWVLGNFSVPADFAALGAPRGLHVVRDFGNGVILYRRARS
jgi:hypothetical protein